MHIHLPKPLHGWREFLGEVGIITLGVLIALGAEQVVESVHWRHKIEQTRRALELELVEDNAPQAYERMAIGGCLDQQLTMLQAAVRSDMDRAKLAPLVRAYGPPAVTWDSEVWQVTLASDVGSHTTPQQMVLWSTPYRTMPALNGFAEREASALGQLQIGDDSPGKLTPEQRERLLLAIHTLRRTNERAWHWSRTLLRALLDIDLEITPEARAKLSGDLRAHFGACVQEPKYTHYNPYDQMNAFKGDAF